MAANSKIRILLAMTSGVVGLLEQRRLAELVLCWISQQEYGQQSKVVFVGNETLHDGVVLAKSLADEFRGMITIDQASVSSVAQGVTPVDNAMGALDMIQEAVDGGKAGNPEGEIEFTMVGYNCNRREARQVFESFFPDCALHEVEL